GEKGNQGRPGPTGLVGVGEPGLPDHPELEATRDRLERACQDPEIEDLKDPGAIVGYLASGSKVTREIRDFLEYQDPLGKEVWECQVQKGTWGLRDYQAYLVSREKTEPRDKRVTSGFQGPGDQTAVLVKVPLERSRESEGTEGPEVSQVLWVLWDQWEPKAIRDLSGHPVHLDNLGGGYLVRRVTEGLQDLRGCLEVKVKTFRALRVLREFLACQERPEQMVLAYLGQ
uniref:Collagen, type XXVIII, alpha 1b n=1 Tax=Hippocampus comes TaxID=109280 RepID=A0A3Q2YNS4_HIPCM